MVSGKEVVFFEIGVAGVRTPDLEHQKRTLYPLRYAPPGLLGSKNSSYYASERDVTYKRLLKQKFS